MTLKHLIVQDYCQLCIINKLHSLCTSVGFGCTFVRNLRKKIFPNFFLAEIEFCKIGSWKSRIRRRRRTRSRWRPREAVCRSEARPPFPNFSSTWRSGRRCLPQRDRGQCRACRPSPGGLAQCSSHLTVEEKIRVQIPRGCKIF
jgi:hypothetical protein